ncbi:MAG: hypothetical protein M3247_05850 [Thermoproteota archaeon]|nr:hypothetical protein [Thermoproteota archaeon]
MKQQSQKGQINDNNNNNYLWDAKTNEKVSSSVQLEWGNALLEKRRWSGNEIVMM